MQMLAQFYLQIDSLFYDPHLAGDAVYTTSDRTPIPVRVVTRRADEITGFSDARIWSETTRIDLRVTEVSAPRTGDQIDINGEAFIIQGEPTRDRERLIWTVDLRPA